MVNPLTAIVPTSGILRVFVPGVPAPQGSKSFVGRARSGRAILVESSRAVKPWRATIAEALRKDGLPLLIYAAHVPVHATLTFVMPRPKATPRGTNPPATKRPDLDKLVRAVFDAIGTAEVWHDDSQVTMLSAFKRVADPFEETGVVIYLQPNS